MTDIKHTPRLTDLIPLEEFQSAVDRLINAERNYGASGKLADEDLDDLIHLWTLLECVGLKMNFSLLRSYALHEQLRLIPTRRTRDNL